MLRGYREDSSSFEMGESSGRDEDVLGIGEDATSSSVIFITHELTVYDVYGGFRESDERWDPLDQVFG
jgi:ribulose kinase